MASRGNLISDLAQMANGAASALGGVREEIDNMIRQRLERTLNARGLVTREEFDALRTRHEALAARLAVFESQESPESAESLASGSVKSAKKTSKKTAKTSSAKAKAKSAKP